MLCQKRYFEVLVRVIEGRDLDTGALRVRAMLDGSQKATRISTSGVPKWKQVKNIPFLKKVSFFFVNSQFFHSKLRNFPISINYQIQNLQFTLKNVSLQKLTVMMLTLKVGKCNKYHGKY